MSIAIGFEVNGRQTDIEVTPNATLLGLIRDQLGLTGTKEGCSEGECGACTVLVDGKPVDSCIYLAAQVDGRVVLTVEGLPATRAGVAIAEGFVAAGGIQCGFCTPGFVVTLTALLQENPEPSEDAVKLALVGNICRCTGYSQILDAVAMAAAAIKEHI